jgi:hypothetical protein
MGTIPPLPASAWLQVLMVDGVDLWDIVPGMCPEIEDELTSAVLDGFIPPDALRETCLDTIEMVSGRSWWFTTRLIATVAKSWEVVGGELAFRNVDASRISLGAWLDAALAVCLRALEPDKITMFMSQLDAPPFEAKVPEPEMDRAAFLAMGA